MKPDLQSHLTDKALDDVLIGLGSLVSHAHLAQCNQCRSRVELFQSNVDRFNQASLAFSTAQSNKARPASWAARRFLGRPLFAAWAGAAALLILAGPTAWHFFPPHPAQAPVVATDRPESETQIAEDNELLRKVSAAIATDERNVVEPYQLQTMPSQPTGPGMK